MGSSFSSLPIKELPESPGLGDLPESCVALILTYLDPQEICRLACLNRAFREAASADIVWESKLPHNYYILAKKLLFNGEYCSDQMITSSKKQIFDRLCCPNQFDCNTKEVWMEKNGQICFAISWKGLKITGINDRRYWKHISTDESSFQSVAYLQQIWWLEVEGSLDFEFPEGNYSLFFRLQLGKTLTRHGRRGGVCNNEQIHGWNLKPVHFNLCLPDGQHVTSKYYLNEADMRKWKEYYVGDFVVHNGQTPTNLKFSMTQIDCTHSKGGLCLDSVFIFPSKLGKF